MEKKLLVVVDMQKDFITGALGNKECHDIPENVATRIKQADQEGYEVVFTMDTHSEQYLDTQEGRNLPVKHCIEGTDGWKLEDVVYESIASAVCVAGAGAGAEQESEGTEKQADGDGGIYERQCCFKKTCFGSPQLGKYIAEHQYETVELIGVCTDICVISNAMLIKAFAPEAKIYVRESCCAGVTPERHKTALDAMTGCQISIV